MGQLPGSGVGAEFLHRKSRQQNPAHYAQDTDGIASNTQVREKPTQRVSAALGAGERGGWKSWLSWMPPPCSPQEQQLQLGQLVTVLVQKTKEHLCKTKLCPRVDGHSTADFKENTPNPGCEGRRQWPGFESPLDTYSWSSVIQFPHLHKENPT